jgi:hypothetical protein
MATAVHKAAQAAALGAEYVQITELNSTFQTVTGSAATLYFVEIDNSNNANDAVSVKLYDSAAPTVGTDDPELILTAAKGAVLPVPLHQGMAFSTAITAAAVKESGTAGTTSPDNDVDVKFYI